MRTVLILNPASGLSMLATNAGTPEEHEIAILTALRAHGIEPEVRYTTLEDPGRGLARQAAAEGADVVIAAGGDGTVHEVATGLVGSKSALGIIPLGTMNNLAHSLNIPETIEEACAVIAGGETHAIDVGKINDQFFTEVAGVGLEAALFTAGEEVKGPGIILTVRGIINGLRTLLAFRPVELRIFIGGGKRYYYRAIQVTICNSRYYGLQFELVPEALMDDGLLDVVIFKNFSKLEYIRHAISISQRRRVYQPKLIHRRVKSLYIRTDHPVEIQADGLPHGYTPAAVTINAGALRVRVPARVAAELEAEEAIAKAQGQA
jgi:diacylglycerol kinase (ATP)